MQLVCVPCASNTPRADQSSGVAQRAQPYRIARGVRSCHQTPIAGAACTNDIPANHQELPDLQQLDLLRQPLGTLIGTLMLLSGIALLRLSWMRRNGGGASISMTGGWVLVAAGIASFAYAWGGEAGTVYALVAFSAVAYVVVAMEVSCGLPVQDQIVTLPSSPKIDRRTGLVPSPRACSPSCWPGLPQSASASPSPSPCRWRRLTASLSAAYSFPCFGVPAWPGH